MCSCGCIELKRCPRGSMKLELAQSLLRGADALPACALNSNLLQSA